MIARFVTREMAGVEVRIRDTRTVTDEEGYFSVELPRTSARATDVRAHLTSFGNSAQIPIVETHPHARYGIISDIDDTLIRTDAWSLWRNILNTLTGNVASRQVFPDAVALLERLHAGVNPVFYVSSSPWNLHAFLVRLFEQNGLIPGPMFLRDFGFSETQFIKGSHGDHKGQMIDKVLAANPDLAFVLIGDTGQHDPEIYHSAVQRHPERFTQAYFRIPNRALDTADRQWIGKMRDLGVRTHAGEDFGTAG